MQAVSCASRWTTSPARTTRIDRPAGYELVMAHLPRRAGRTGRSAWSRPTRRTLEPVPRTLLGPTRTTAPPLSPSSATPADKDLWVFRRISRACTFGAGARERHHAGQLAEDRLLRGPLFGVPDEEAAATSRRRAELSLLVLYWLQTEAPRPDGGTG